MNKELDMKNIKKALIYYINKNGYTKSSLAKKCFIERDLFKMFLEDKFSMNKDIEESILHTILEKEKITLVELLKYIDKNEAFEIYQQELLNSKISLFNNKERNPERIPLFLKELEEFWIVNPDLRFGQIISILEKELNEDSFNAEDEKWFNALNNIKYRDI